MRLRADSKAPLQTVRKKRASIASEFAAESVRFVSQRGHTLNEANRPQRAHLSLSLRRFECSVIADSGRPAPSQQIAGCDTKLTFAKGRFAFKDSKFKRSAKLLALPVAELSWDVGWAHYGLTRFSGRRL